MSLLDILPCLHTCECPSRYVFLTFSVAVDSFSLLHWNFFSYLILTAHTLFLLMNLILFCVFCNCCYWPLPKSTSYIAAVSHYLLYQPPTAIPITISLISSSLSSDKACKLVIQFSTGSPDLWMQELNWFRCGTKQFSKFSSIFSVSFIAS